METIESIKSVGAKSSMRSSEPFEICPFEIQKYKLYICLKTKIDPNEQLDDHESAKLLENFMPQNVRIITTVFYGNARIRSIAFTGKTKFIVGKVNNAKQDRKEFEIVVSHEKFCFSDLDPSSVEGIDGERDSPYIIIRLIYVVTDQQIADKLAQMAIRGSTAPGALQLGFSKIEMNKTSSGGKYFWKPPLYATKVDLTSGPFRNQEKNSANVNNLKELVLVDSEGSYIEVDISESDNGNTALPPIMLTSNFRSDHIFPKRTFWTQYNPRTQAILPRQISNAESFDIYIDQVKFLPDNCRMCKVTGRIFKSGITIPDLEALPILDSDARNPAFKHRSFIEVSADNEVDSFAILVIRVYIQDNQSSDLVVLGSGLLVLYQIERKNELNSQYEGLLNHGGHQVRLYWGFPAENIPLGTDSFSDNTPIPGICSVLIRLLPHTKDFTAAPNYQTGYYKSDTCEPTECDVRVLSHYLRHESFPRTVRDSIELRLTKRDGSSSQSDQNLIAYMREKLDRRSLVANQSVPKFVQLENCLDYDIGSGVFAKIEQAYGLSSENFYCSCFARLSVGEESRGMHELPEGVGGECKFIVNSHDYTSLQISPRWKDKAYKMNPHFDEFTCILIQIFVLDVKYVGDPDAQKPGTVLPKEGKENLALDPENQMGWTAVNLFKGKSVNAAVHYLPVFESQPSLVFIEKAMSMSVMNALGESINECAASVLDNCASLKVKLFDGNFVDEKQCIPLQENFDLEKKMVSIGAVNRDSFDERRKNKSGKVYSELVLSTMPEQDQKSPSATLQSNKYKKAEHYYEMAMSDTFHNLLEDQMMEAAMGPFTTATSDEQFDPESLFYNFG